ncbi:hypothetical protein Eyrgjafa_gp_9 [Pelagibacter phage Eyrgjafa EXVC018P]|uniref:Uncharacterized protein n=1 Tax=Pelagibacter phage Eyrgjafa EXVC018P TaxID=2736227 RepID=A0A7S5YDH9_9CAUD|nr:hypothetical protein Eyrgjafa_gp_9 [Pelagibacter phage Eyrgjafa EXVC018P]QLF88214.1 hypothetical protein Gjalp_gp22 [Pelagibacter phage Gjalp EXVC020P]
MSKVMYLKSLFNNDKPNKKAIKLIDEAIVKANGVNPRANPKTAISSKEFILRHTEDFLNYAVDYTLDEKIRNHFSE